MKRWCICITCFCLPALAFTASLPGQEQINTPPQAQNITLHKPDIIPPMHNKDVLSCVAKRDRWRTNYSISPSGEALVSYRKSSDTLKPYKINVKQNGTPYTIFSSIINFEEKTLSPPNTFWTRKQGNEKLIYWVGDNEFAFTDAEDQPSAGGKSSVNVLTGVRTEQHYTKFWTYGNFPESQVRPFEARTDFSRPFSELYGLWKPNNFGLPVLGITDQTSGTALFVASDYTFPNGQSKSLDQLRGGSINWDVPSRPNSRRSQLSKDRILPVHDTILKDNTNSGLSLSLLPFGKFSPDAKISDESNVSYFYFLSDYQSNFISLFRYDADRKAITRVFSHDQSDIMDVAHSRYGDELFWVRMETKFSIHYPANESGKALLELIKPEKYEKISIIDVDKHNNTFLISRDSHIGGPRLELLKLDDKKTLRIDACQINSQLPWSNNEIVETETSDGAIIYTNIYRPLSHSNGKTITYLHGGPTYKENMSWENLYFKSLIDKGYTVLAPNYRGSTGYGKAFRDGGRQNFDLARKDVIEAVNHLISTFQIPQDGHIIMGNSFGAYLAASVASLDETPFDIVVVRNGFYDIIDFIEKPVDLGSARKLVYLKDSPVFGDVTDNVQKKYLDSVSPAHNVETLNIPILIVHARKDRKVPYSQSSQYYKLLSASGCLDDCELMTIDGGHSISDLDVLDIYISKVDDFINAKFDARNGMSLPIARPIIDDLQVGVPSLYSFKE